MTSNCGPIRMNFTSTLIYSQPKNQQPAKMAGCCFDKEKGSSLLLALAAFRIAPKPVVFQKTFRALFFNLSIGCSRI